MPTMRRSKALLIAATLLCAALATMWALWSRGKDGPPIAQPQPTTTESTSAENNTARTGPEPEQTERQPAASPRERVEPIRAESNAAQGVRGRIVDESGAPIAGAKVALLDSASNDPLGKFLAQAQQIPNLALSAAQSDLAGTFLLGLVTPTERKLQLCAVADGYAAEVHGDLAVADDVGACAHEGERTGVVGHDPADQRRQPVTGAVLEGDVADEGDHARAFVVSESIMVRNAFDRIAIAAIFCGQGRRSGGMSVLFTSTI